MEELHPDFVSFVAKNNISEDSFQIESLSRFVRINPRKSISQEELQQQLNHEFPALECTLTQVPWLTEFFSLPSHVKLVSLLAYKNGQIYGLDVSSGAVVKALAPEPNDNILDLCCAPGGKLCYISDCVSTVNANMKGTVTGVDVSHQRLAICRTLCNKYLVPNVRLFEADACHFDILAPDLQAEPPVKKSKKKRTSSPTPTPSITPVLEPPAEPDMATFLTKPTTEETLVLPQTTTTSTTTTSTTTTSTTTTSTTTTTPISSIKIEIPEKKNESGSTSEWQRRKRRKKRYRDDLNNLFFCNYWKMRTSQAFLYDKVLVDAPCTLDASVRHILQFKKLGWEQFDMNISETMSELQKKIIWNGYKLLKPGGVMVYSTCSFCKIQNEDVIQWLLDTEKTAVIVPITTLPGAPTTPGFLPNTLRFHPKNTGTSGMFIAKILKSE